MINFDKCVGYEVGFEIYFPYGYPIILALFVAKALFSPLNCFGTFENQMPYNCKSVWALCSV